MLRRVGSAFRQQLSAYGGLYEIIADGRTTCVRVFAFIIAAIILLPWCLVRFGFMVVMGNPYENGGAK